MCWLNQLMITSKDLIDRGDARLDDAKVFAAAMPEWHIHLESAIIEV